MTIQQDLFAEQVRSVSELSAPTMSYADCTLNFTKYQEPIRSGLGMFEDDVVPQTTTVTRCSLPTWANITEIVKSREQNFTIYGLAEHKSAGELINWWLEKIDYPNFETKRKNKDTPAGKWITAHAAEMNTARRIWDALRKAADVLRLKEQLSDLQERIRVAELTLNIKIAEAAANRNFIVEEKQLKLKELGALDRDLAA